MPDPYRQSLSLEQLAKHAVERLGDDAPRHRTLQHWCLTGFMAADRIGRTWLVHIDEAADKLPLAFTKDDYERDWYAERHPRTIQRSSAQVAQQTHQLLLPLGR
ncbi:MAG: hypothetical protein AAFY08_13040 [Planctomycetota bacterium]